MNLEKCFICNFAVLELKGQFEKLDPYVLNEHELAFKKNAFGWCHSKCLCKSTWGAFWAEQQVWHKVHVMGFEEIVRTRHFSIIRNPRDSTIAIIRSDGVTFNIDASALLLIKKVKNEDIMLPVSEEINIEFDNSAIVNEIKHCLIRNLPYPLQFVVDIFDINEKLIFPKAIDEGYLQFDKKLKQYWIGNWISAKAVYHQFIPKTVVELINS